MIQTLIYPSSEACDYSVELPHWLLCSRFVLCWRFGAVGFEWCPCCSLQPGHHSNPATQINALPDDGVTVTPKHVRAVLM